MAVLLPREIFLERLEVSNSVQLLQSPADPVLGYVAYRRRTSDLTVCTISQAAGLGRLCLRFPGEALIPTSGLVGLSLRTTKLVVGIKASPGKQRQRRHIILISNDDDEDEEDAAAYDVAPDIILILSDDDEDEEDAAACVIVIPSDDEVDEKEVKTLVSVIGRKRVYALIDESDNDEEY
ncbi:hypothetical protein Tco_0813378 [Tanacetum coccineum]